MGALKYLEIGYDVLLPLLTVISNSTAYPANQVGLNVFYLI